MNDEYPPGFHRSKPKLDRSPTRFGRLIPGQALSKLGGLRPTSADSWPKSAELLRPKLFARFAPNLGAILVDVGQSITLKLRPNFVCGPESDKVGQCWGGIELLQLKLAVFPAMSTICIRSKSAVGTPRCAKNADPALREFA